ncbi:MAG TPA: hypothetical protein VGP86_06630 [Xanthobacteraceae bacterium]|nr:hypothetical protein [Xanthobacteraceae bacterium]
MRICLANAQALGKRSDAVARFMRRYLGTIDRTYSDLAALSVYQELSGLRHEPMAKIRDLRPDDIRGRDLMLADSLTNEFSAKLLTADRIEEMIRISAPTK